MTREQALKYREAIKVAADNVTDEVADSAAFIFEAWNGDGVDYVVGDRRRYDGVVYKCITAHKSQEDWMPSVASSLWARAHIDVAEWVQPTGASDAYKTGDKVKHNDKVWISTVDANVWEPGVYGWDEVN
jgi:hypothetical protein